MDEMKCLRCKAVWNQVKDRATNYKERVRYAEFFLTSGVATYDPDTLTKLVVCAHDMGVRAEIQPFRGKIKVLLHPRDRYCKDFLDHPTMDMALREIRGNYDDRTSQLRFCYVVDQIYSDECFGS